MKTLQVQVCIRHDEQGPKSMQSLTFLVWSERTLGMHLSGGG